MGPNKDGLVRGGLVEALKGSETARLKGHEKADKIIITYNKKISL